METTETAIVKKPTGRPRKGTNPSAVKNSRFVRIEDVAAYMGVGTELVRRKIKNENFPAHKISRCTVVFDLDEVANWIKSRSNTL